MRVPEIAQQLELFAEVHAGDYLRIAREGERGAALNKKQCHPEQEGRVAGERSTRESSAQRTETLRPPPPSLLRGDTAFQPFAIPSTTRSRIRFATTSFGARAMRTGSPSRAITSTSFSSE